MPHILRSIKPYQKDFNTEEAIESCFVYITTVVASSNCKRPPGASHRNTNCTCMYFLGERENNHIARDAASYLVRWAGFDRVRKRETLHTWHHMAASYASNHSDKFKGKKYVLPLCARIEGGNEDDSQNQRSSFLICRNALTGLLDVGVRMWKTSMNDPLSMHSNTGKRSNNTIQLEEVYQSLDAFFESLGREGSPFATRVIREESGLTTRDDNPDEVALPPHMTKHRCYARWCWERGWKVAKKNRTLTIYDKVEHFPMRENDDDCEVPLWPTGSEPKKIISWPTFLNYWKSNFPHIKVRKKGADTCTDCLILANEFRMGTRTGVSTSESAGSDNNDSNHDDESSRGNDEEDSEQNLEAVINVMESLLGKAKAHVKQYQIQKQQKDHIISVARLDISNNLPSLFRRRVITIDMGQNLSLPNFAGEQPGDTYYFSPITVYLFGVVDCATSDKHDRMNAYIWPEYEGDRGANNICSCLLKDFKLRGFLDNPSFADLTIIADNCGGQNKNRHVVRFLMWLVEMGYFPRIMLFFLVKGHTKNSCDRLFNLVKLDYHKRNTYTYDEMLENIDKNEFITAIRMTKNDMFDFLEWQDKYYRPPEGGEFNQTHIFTIERINGMKATTMRKQDEFGAAIREDSLLPTRRNKKCRYMDPIQRKSAIARMLDELKLLEPPGLRPIKQVELYMKWAPLLPKDAAKITCPRPSDEVLNTVRDEKRCKAAKSRNDKKTKKSDEEKKTICHT